LPPVSCLHFSHPYNIEISSTSDSPADYKIRYWHNEASYTVYTITVTVQIRQTGFSWSASVFTEIKVNGELRKYLVLFVSLT